MLAVLPFQNLSGDPAQDYFGDGLTEETITELAQVSPEKLGLIARTSAMAYKRTPKTVAQIGNELGVDYVLEGSVRRDAENVRVSVQLIRVRDQTHVWAHSYDREIRNLLALESDLGEGIAEQIEVQLASNARIQLAKQRTIDPEAHEAYLKGRHFWNEFRLDSLNQAITFYQQALEKDSQYADAYAGLAVAYSVRANLYGKPSEDYARAREAAQRALELDGTLAEAHEAIAAVHIFNDWDWAAADKELRRCEELGAPSQEHSLRAYWYEARGDTASAISVLKRGLRLDPFNPLLNADLGFAYYYARQPDGLIAQYRQTKEADPNFPLANGMLALAYQEKGDLSAAAAEYRRLGDRVALAVVQAKQGDVRAARALLDKMRKNSSKESPDPPAMVSLCHALGDKDCTFTWLEKEYADRDPWLIWLRVTPANDDLRSDTRFQRLSYRIGLQ
jgi:TolB-like protein